MRNFKKTLSLVLSVLMLVSCCSVVFSTFASAYTTNDETTPKYGVYTYDFVTKDADGNAIDTYPSQHHSVLNAGSYNWPNTQNPQSYISISGEEKGLHMTSSYEAKTTTVGKSAYMSKTFLRDPDSAISLTNDVSAGCYLVMESGVTYTFVVKYKVEDITAGNTGIIGIGMFDYKIAVSPTAGTGGTVQVIGFSEARSSVDSEWQYYTVTVNADELEFNTDGPDDGKMYVILTAGSMTNHSSDPGDVSNGYVTFHVDSVTVVAVDNKYKDIFTLSDDTTEDGSLTENVYLSLGGQKYNFVDNATGDTAYPTNNHDTFSKSNDKFDSGKNAGKYKSYVDATGMHMTTEYGSTPSATARNWAARAFVRDPDPSFSLSDSVTTNCFLAIPNNANATYYFSLKYRIEDLDPDDNGVNATNVKIGLGFLDHNQPESSLSARTGPGGYIKALTSESISAAMNPANADVDSEGNEFWRYLDFSVNSDDLTFTDAKTTLLNKYIVIFGSSTSSAPVKFHIESLSVAKVSNDSELDVINYVANLKEKENTINVADFDVSRFAQYGYAQRSRNLETGDKQGTEIFAALGKVSLNEDGSLTLPTTAADGRFMFYQHNNIFSDKYNATQNALIIKAGYRYNIDLVYSYTATESDGEFQIYPRLWKDISTTGNAWAYGKSIINTPTADIADENLDALKIPAGTTSVTKQKHSWTFNATDDDKGFILGFWTPKNAGDITIHSIKVTYYSTNLTTPVIEEVADGEKVYYTIPAGMTLPRPADENGKIGSHWIDVNGDPVSNVGETGYKMISAVYKNDVIDFEDGQDYYDPNNKWGKGYLNNLKIDNFAPDGSSNTAVRWEEMYWSGSEWATQNISYLSFTVNGVATNGFKVKPNTTYKLSMNYFVDTILDKSTFGMQIRVSDALHIGRGSGVSKNFETIADNKTISSAASERGEWDEFTIEFTTPEDVSEMPYLSLCFLNTGSRFESLGHIYTDPDLTGWIKAYVDNIVIEEITTASLDECVEDSYTSIREEIAAKEQTSALRVSAAISEVDAKKASEIGFIALPTEKTTADWYKFGDDGKLSGKALSVKVKDDVNGLGIPDHEDITELLAPTTVPVDEGQKAYQVIITGLQTIGNTSAGLRNDAISVVLYTKDDDGNYTYYFVNEVSYDQTMTMYAMSGKDIAKYKY